VAKKKRKKPTTAEQFQKQLARQLNPFIEKKGRRGPKPKVPKIDKRVRDILGGYRKQKRVDGEQVQSFTVGTVPVHLVRRFRAAAVIHDDTARKATIRFMEQYCSVIEEKYNVMIDPTLMED